MPFHLPLVSRRQFLGSSLVAFASAGSGRMSGAAYSTVDPHRWILTADTHIAADRAKIHNNVKLAKNLEQVVAEVLPLDPIPSGLILNGDAALTAGLPGDYATLGELLKPLTGALPVHLTLGNHDHRKNFRAGLAQGAGRSPLESHHVAVVESVRANWFLLDSLDQVNETPGKLGKGQMDWLTKELDARSGKPALIVIHHDPKWPGETRSPSLTDSEAFYAALAPRKHVKAIFCGHTHVWKRNQRDGIHLVNLPPVAYVFSAGLPNGWVDVQLAEKGAALVLHSLDARHKQSGEKVELAWRPS